MHIRSAVIMLTVVIYEATSLAWALDCEGRLVSLGQTPWEVYAVCGAPTPNE